LIKVKSENDTLVLNIYSDNLEGKLQAKQRFIHEMNQSFYLVSGRPVGGRQRHFAP